MNASDRPEYPTPPNVSTSPVNPPAKAVGVDADTPKSVGDQGGSKGSKTRGRSSIGQNGGLSIICSSASGPTLFELSRFWSRVDFSEGCWLWEGCTRALGYGGFWYRGHQRLAHRFAYEAEVGPIPEGLTLDHLCRVRLCVNPAHLDAVPDRENVARGNCPTALNARKTHCVRGHAFDEANTYLLPRGGRACRACLRLGRMRRYWSA